MWCISWKKSTPSIKDLYLQIYKSFYVPGVGKRNNSFKTIGHVSDLIASGIDDPISCYQNVDKYLDLASANKSFRFQLSQFIKSLIYAQVANPGSKLKAFENVIPSIYNITNLYYDQILDGIEYIGMDYSKFIEIFNFQINKVYLALTILRLLEIKEFNNKISTAQIIEFIRQYSVTYSGESILINNAIKSKTFSMIKDFLGLSKLSNAFLKNKDINLY